jgi:hypothetical protein
MKFESTHKYFNTKQIFSEDNAPDWLTGKKTIKGSTMDCRWFWTDYILKLKIGETKETDFYTIKRIE